MSIGTYWLLCGFLCAVLDFIGYHRRKEAPSPEAIFWTLFLNLFLWPFHLFFALLKRLFRKP